MLCFDGVYTDSFTASFCNAIFPYLKVCLEPGGKQWCSANHQTDISELIETLSGDEIVLVVLEPLGVWNKRWQALEQAGIAVTVTNPRRVRDSAKASGKLARTDWIDLGVLFATDKPSVSNCAHLQLSQPRNGKS